MGDGGSGRGRAAAPGGDGLARLLARLAVLGLAGDVLVLAFAVGEGSLVVLGGGLLGLVLCVVGLWWFVAHRGLVRFLGALLAVAAPAAVLVLLTFEGCGCSHCCWRCAGPRRWPVPGRRCAGRGRSGRCGRRRRYGPSGRC